MTKAFAYKEIDCAEKCNIFHHLSQVSAVAYTLDVIYTILQRFSERCH